MHNDHVLLVARYAFEASRFTDFLQTYAPTYSTDLILGIDSVSDTNGETVPFKERAYPEAPELECLDRTGLERDSCYS